MAVATDTILRKMKKELSQAQQHSDNETNMVKHIANIQLLCELLLEEKPDSDAGTKHDITAEEMKAMMGEKAIEQASTPARTTVDHDGANGDSIFDF